MNRSVFGLFHHCWINFQAKAWNTQNQETKDKNSNEQNIGIFNNVPEIIAPTIVQMTVKEQVIETANGYGGFCVGRGRGQRGQGYRRHGH